MFRMLGWWAWTTDGSAGPITAIPQSLGLRLALRIGV